MKVIYLAGMSRSGTTLAERLLGELPQVTAIGETIHLWQRGLNLNEHCGCGKPFSDCHFWRRAGELAYGGWEKIDVRHVEKLRFRVNRTRHIPALASVTTPRYDSALREYLRIYEYLYEAVSPGFDDAIVDSSKHASLAWCLSHSDRIDLRVVHIVRDSRAVAYSWTREKKRDVIAGNYMRKQHPARTAMLWNTQNAFLDLLARQRDVLRIRYEDMVDDPEGILRDIAEFAGLDSPRLDFLGWDGNSYLATLTPSHQVAGNPLRFATGQIRISPDISWRTHLPSRKRELVTTLTAPLLARYGYFDRVAPGVGVREWQAICREKPELRLAIPALQEAAAGGSPRDRLHAQPCAQYSQDGAGRPGVKRWSQR